jgi:hypothetical protein
LKENDRAGVRKGKFWYEQTDPSQKKVITRGELPSNFKKIQFQLETSGDILIRVVTWNQQARESPECLTKLLFPHKYHIVAVGTQECENSFAMSMIQPAKPNWESCLESALGCSENYDILRSHSLQASHM